MTTKELIGNIKEMAQHRLVGDTFFIEVLEEAIQRLRQLDELKEIIRLGVPLTEEFLKDLEVHEK